MNRMVVKSRVGSDGILHLDLPVGVEQADKEVQVTVEPVASKKAMTQEVRVTVESFDSPAIAQEEWRRLVLETAGKWQGEFERPQPGALEEREPLS